MTESESGINVGGVSFDISVNLAAFEAALAKAEQLARQHAQRMQHILTTTGGVGPSGPRTGSGGGTSSPSPSGQAAIGVPRTVDVNQTVNVNRNYRVTNRVIGGPLAASQVTGGSAPRNATPEEIADIIGGRGGPQRTLSQSEIDRLTTRPANSGSGSISAASLMRAQQQAAQRQAVFEGRPYSNTATMRQIGLTDAEKITRQDAELERRFGPGINATNAARQRIRISAQQQTAREARNAPVYGPQPLSAAQLTRNLQRQQAAMGPHQVSPSVLARFQSQQYGNNGGNGGSGRGGGSNGFYEFLFGNTGETQARSFLRVGAALTGVGLGINIAAGAARLLNEAITSAANAAVQLELSGRAIGVAFGSAASGFAGVGAAQFAANPLTSGTTTQYQQTVASQAPLADQFQLSNQQVQQLVTSEGELARLHGVELPQAGQVLQQVLRGNLQAGQALDLELTDQYGALKNVGLTWEELVNAEGPAAATATVLKAVLADTDRQLANNAQHADSTTQSLDKLGKAWDNARNNLAKGMQGPVTLVINTITNALTGLDKEATSQTTDSGQIAPGQIAGYRVPATTPGGPITGPVRQLPSNQRYLPDGEIIELSPAQTSPNQPVPTAALPAGYAQMVADQSALEAEAHAAVPPATPFGPTDEDATSGAREIQRRSALQTSVAQANLDALSAQADQRKLAVSGSINNLTQQHLDLEGQLAGMLLQQQGIQDQIQITTRENLAITQQSLEAQQAAIGPASQVSQYDFQRQLASARIQLGIAQDVTGQQSTVDIGQEALNILHLSPAMNPAVAQANIANLYGQQGVAQTGFAAQASQNQRQLAAIPLEEQLQNLQLGPGGVLSTQLDLATNQAASDAINRYLQLQDLSHSPDVIAAEQALADARQKSAEAAGVIAGQQNQGPNSAGPVNITVDLGGLTVSPDVQSMIDQITKATSSATLDALSRAAGLSSPRVDPNVAAGR